MSSGGVNWYRQSRLTVWGNRTFNRQSLYHRRPQTRLTNTPEIRYKNYYEKGLIDDGLRYGNRAFQGIFIQGQDIPFNLSFKGVIGKLLLIDPISMSCLIITQVVLKSIKKSMI